MPIRGGGKNESRKLGGEESPGMMQSIDGSLMSYSLVGRGAKKKVSVDWSGTNEQASLF